MNGPLPPRQWAARLRPTTIPVAVAASAAFGVFLGVLGSLVNPEAPVSMSWLAWALAFGAPMLAVFLQGHFGTEKWDLPTPAGFMFTWWLVAIGPSIVVVPTLAQRFAHHSADAVYWGRVVALSWFALFALALGRTKLKYTMLQEEVSRFGRNPGVAAAFVVVLGVWLLSILVAYDYGMLSQWGGSKRPPAAGSFAMAAILLYGVLTQLVVPLALLIVLVGTKRARLLGLTGLMGGGVMLFVYSSRRSWVIAVYLCLLVIRAARARLRLRWIATALLVGWIGAGPLVWVFRGASGHASGHEDPFAVAVDSVTRYATSAKAREDSLVAQTGNLEVRLGVSVPYFGTVQHALERGANVSPSPLAAFVRLVPTQIWAEKNEVAESLSIWQQLLATRRFPPVDITVIPPTEFVFQVGLALAPLGSLLYVLVARLLDWSSSWGLRSVESMLVWCALFSAGVFFDGGVGAPFLVIREASAAALVAYLIRILLFPVSAEGRTDVVNGVGAGSKGG